MGMSIARKVMAVIFPLLIAILNHFEGVCYLAAKDR